VKRHKSLGIDQIMAEINQAGANALCYEINKPNFIWNEEELPQQWKALIMAPIYKKGDKND
jgi:hypothetical protein